MRLWMKRELLNQIEAPSAYLMRIATNRVLDHLRRKAIEYKLLQNRDNARYAEAVENQFSFRESKRILDEAVAKLSSQQRTIYFLQQDGYSYEEIATYLKISAHTVRNHLARAFKYLRAHMERQGLSLFLMVFLTLQ